MDIVTLRRALTAALKARDTAAVAALRSALAAIENAGAVDPTRAPAAGNGPIAGAVAGLGAAEVARRTLTPTEIRALVATEVEQRRAERLQAEADVLAAHLRS